MKYKPVDTDKIMREIAKELDIPFSEVRYSIDDVFQVTRDILREPLKHDKIGVLLHKFGTFEINRGVWRHMKNKVEPFKDKEVQEMMDKRISDYYKLNKKNGKRTEQQEKEDHRPKSESDRG
jgi:hypothetical protein